MNEDEFFSQLTTQDLVLTANRRLAAYLKDKYDESQMQRGFQAWPSLSVVPLHRYIEKIWEKYSNDSRVLLSDFQELIIWEQIITESSISEGLLNPHATAPLVKDSWKLLQQWSLDIKDIDIHFSLDVQTFIHWVREFKQKCDSLNCLSRSELLHLFLQNLMQFSLCYKFPQRIFLVGFDDITPSIRKFEKCLTYYSEVIICDLRDYQENIIHRTCLPDKEQELIHMALWSYQLLQENPNVKIAGILPNLASERHKVKRIFEEIFLALHLQTQFSSMPFNISAANSFVDYPIIHTAFMILSLNYEEIDIEELCYLLRSPFTAEGETELNPRAIFDAKLRSYGEQKIYVKDLLQLDCLELKYCPIWQKNIKAFFENLKTAKELHKLEEWAAFFTMQLSSMGWPGQRVLNSTEFQLVERWKVLFDEFIQLGFIISDAISFSEALHLLKKIANLTLFQPKSDNAPIQILGVLEATGMNFDYLWMAGLDNETWPPPPSPNPFIPIEIQRKYNMPHATSERELQFSVAVTNRFSKSAKELVFSYPMHEGDRVLMPSSLIIHYPEKKLDIAHYTTLGEQIYATQNLEYFIDEQGPSVQDFSAIRGGSWIFKAQAACPFRAFAQFRLHADPLDTTQLGLAFHERGSLVHDVLAKVWSEIKNHHLLCHFSEGELNNIILNAINQALEPIKTKKPFTIKPRFLFLEKTRLQKMIFEWLQIEKLRQPFSVLYCEEWQITKFGELEIHVQIDRIDILENGSWVIIDYKTGKPSLNDWFSERPNEPQLPLYSIISDQNIAGILFAQIRSDKMLFKGITTFNDIVPGAMTLEKLKIAEFQDWAELSKYWRSMLENLAKDFCNGVAKVDPKNGGATCLYCHLHELCRVNELSAAPIVLKNS